MSSRFTSWIRGWDSLAIAMGGLLVAVCIFGGASREHALRLALVELAALPLLALALIQLSRRPDARTDHRFILILATSLIALPLLQLIPLPPRVWTGLPGRQQSALALEIVGIQPGWSSLSLTPVVTGNMAIALIPPLAAFLGLMLSRSERLAMRCIHGLLAFGLVSIFIGAVQLASGDQRFYAWNSTGSGFIVGLFANRNHFATLMLTCLPFASLIAARQVVQRPEQTAVVGLLVATAFAVIGLSIGASQSRAGVLLFLPVLLLSIVVGWRGARLGRPRPMVLIGGGFAVALALGAAVLFVPQILERFEPSQTVEGRFRNWPIVAEAAGAYLPLGSGVGSFDPIYRSVEPLEHLDPTYFNHAHNEYLEIWLETGWLGAGLLIAFLFWFGRRAWHAWFVSDDSDRSVRRAASVAIAAMLAHSFVDYPLRTSVMAVVFAICVVLLEGVRDQNFSTRQRRRT